MNDHPSEVCEERGVQVEGAAAFPPSKLRQFNVQFTAGLRVRASPSLQAEEVGRVPPGSNVTFVEEVGAVY